MTPKNLIHTVFFILLSSTMASAQLCSAADGFEQDDSCSTATLFSNDICQFGLSIQLTDADWFGTTVPPGERVHVALRGHEAASDIDLRLQRGCTTTLLDVDLGPGSSPTVEWVNTTTSSQVVRIQVTTNGGGAFSCTFYDIAATVLAPTPGCNDDQFEPNDCCDIAPELAPGVHALTLQAGNSDWYKIVVPSSRTLEIHGTADEAFEMYLWEDCFATFVDNSTSRVRATHLGPSSKTYLLQVFATGANRTCFPYQLRVDLLGGFASFCNGNGGDQMGCTNCPCGNNAPVASNGGCLHAAGNAALLAPGGFSSVSTPTLNFRLFSALPNSLAVLFSGANRAPGNSNNPCFGLGSGLTSLEYDGLRCVVGNIKRHGNRPTDANGHVGVVNNRWGPPNGPGAGLIVQGGFSLGQSRYFQAVFRDSGGSGCGTGLNTSQAIHVIIFP